MRFHIVRCDECGEVARGMLRNGSAIHVVAEKHMLENPTHTVHATSEPV